MEEAKSQGFSPSDMKEYLPLLDAYLKTSDVESALDLSLRIKKVSDKVDDQVCTAWYAFSESNPTTEYALAFQKIEDRFRCFD